MTDPTSKPWGEPSGSTPDAFKDVPNAAAAAKVRDWPAYFAKVEGKPARETLTDTVAAFAAERLPDAASVPPLAIDLGCGSGRDTLELLQAGWRVHAIDGHPEALARLLYQPSHAPTPRLTIQHATFEQIQSLPPCRLLNASFALPFCPPRAFERLWSIVRTSLLPGARFAGQLFGDRDSWSIIEDRSHFTRAEAEALLDGLEIEHFVEEERDGQDASDNHKHWHVFHIIARNPHP
ncbi:MAG: methyltransferase domain-containing protein [Planctomycetota bacterium]